jgi:hypothetical protein
MVCSLSEAFGDIKSKKSTQGNESHQPPFITNIHSKSNLGGFKPLDSHFNSITQNISANDTDDIYNSYSALKDVKDNVTNPLPDPVQFMNRYQGTTEPVKEVKEEVAEPIVEQPQVEKYTFPEEVTETPVLHESVQEEESYEDRVYITNADYQAFVDYQKNRHSKSQPSNVVEGFVSVEDSFNDIILFAIFGLLYLLLIDFIYKMGKRSY